MPQRGTRKRLMEQACRNAKEALERRLAESTTQARLNREVAELFELAEPPQRIEAALQITDGVAGHGSR